MSKRGLSHSNNKTSKMATGLVISDNNPFLEKLNSLQKLSSQLPSKIELPTVPTEGGFFGLGDHKVTGDELNNLTENIQENMIGTNTTVVKVATGLATVCDTLSALDKVYLRNIYVAINTAVEAIVEIEIANERINGQQMDISAAQQDIRQVIDQQEQIIQVLKNHKERLEKLKHLLDIDKVFNDVRTSKSKIGTLERVSTEHEKSIKNVSVMQAKFSESLDKLNDSNVVFYEKIQDLSDTTGELKTLMSDLEEAVAQNEKDCANTKTTIESIADEQNSLNKSFNKQKIDIERMYAAQREYSNSFSALKETYDKLSVNFTQSVQKTEQRFSEIEQTIEKHNAGFSERCSLFESEIMKCEEATQDFYSETNSIMEQLSANTGEQYETVQNELTALRDENVTLTKSLLFVKGIAFASLALSFVFLVLLLTGVLR